MVRVFLIFEEYVNLCAYMNKVDNLAKYFFEIFDGDNNDY